MFTVKDLKKALEEFEDSAKVFTFDFDENRFLEIKSVNRNGSQLQLNTVELIEFDK